MKPKIINTKMDTLAPLIRERLAAEQNIKFSPRGTSMLPMLREGIDSVVLSSPPEKLCKYDLPLYQRENGQYVLHRVIKVEETYTCIGDNQFAAEQGIAHSQVIAVVTEFYRKDKAYKVSDFRYRLYCRLWHGSRPVRHFWRRGIRWLRRHLS